MLTHCVSPASMGGTETRYHRLSHTKHEHPAACTHPLSVIPVISTETGLSTPTSTGTGFTDQMDLRDNAANPVCRVLAAVASMAAMVIARHIAFDLLFCVLVPALVPIRVPHVLIVAVAVSLAFGTTEYAPWVAGVGCQLLIAGASDVS